MWKTVVVNTPKTLLQILPVLMGQVIAALASNNEDRQVGMVWAAGEGGGQAGGDGVGRGGRGYLIVASDAVP